MEKYWKKQPTAVYKKCFDILNKQSLIETQTYVNFLTELFEIAKVQMGCPECKLVFFDSDKNDLGYASQDHLTVNINLQKIEKQNLYKLVSTIYHELEHFHERKVEDKKQLGVAQPAVFPYFQAARGQSLLPTEILGIDTYLLYYTSTHEKQARDVGNECAMEVFEALKQISESERTATGTARHIDRTIMMLQRTKQEEQKNYNFACAEIKKFFAQNPNFYKNALQKIFAEFLEKSKFYQPFSKERKQLEEITNLRIGALIFLGCDDESKKQIINFTTRNFVFKANVINSLVLVIDSPYSKTTKYDFKLLFDYARQCNCLNNQLLGCFTNWEQQDVYDILREYIAENNVAKDQVQVDEQQNIF